MSAARLTEFRAKLAIKTGQGSRLEMTVRGGDKVNTVTGVKCSAQQALLDAVSQIAVWAEIDGCGGAFDRAVQDARDRLKKRRAESDHIDNGGN